MFQKNKHPLGMMRLAAVLLVLVLLSTSIVCGRYARYVSSDEAVDSARIAAFVFDVNETENHYLDISTIQTPGDSKTCKFTVRNHSGGVTSEVDEEYFLTLELWGSLPLVCTLTGADGLTVDAKEMDATGLDMDTGSKHIFTAAVQQGMDYVLTVSWDDNEKDVAYSRAGLAELCLSVAAQQID